jgi:sugar phosphate isomerase/epimerase
VNIRFFCPLWGSTDIPFPLFLDRVKQAGYDGVEMSLPLDDARQQAEMLTALADRGLTWIAQHYETTDPHPRTHRAEYVRRLENLASAKPLFINSQTGKDWFSFEQNRQLLDDARAVADQHGVTIVHETHRGKFSFSAQATAQYLRADPQLRIAADFSHWCTVSETLLEDQVDAVTLAISRADHIHARIGFPEGPQIGDPRDPNWTAAVAAHLAWWDQIAAARRQSQTRWLTITPEFGPPPYMPTLPFSGKPVASQWKNNLHMMQVLRERYGL